MTRAPALYVHVPYCEATCSYCDFYSVARGDALGHRYADALAAEMTLRETLCGPPSSVFIGGGTPTALSDSDFAQVLGSALDTSTEETLERSVECNPGSLTAEKAGLMRAAGVSRVSIGVQSFDDTVLRSVGRVHTASEARRAVDTAREAGFDNVSIDLLFAIPGQGIATFRADLEAAIELETDHISAYALLYETGTPLEKKLRQGLVEAEEEDTELEMLRIARDTLGAAGYQAYEISNFARPGRECLHNLNYWRNGEYLGLGPSAVSYLSGVRSTNVRSWRDWQTRVLRGESPRVDAESLTGHHAAGEELMLRLRLREGARLADVDRRWNTDTVTLLAPLLGRLQDAELLTIEADAGHRVRLTEAGLPVADGVMSEILALCRAQSEREGEREQDESSPGQARTQGADENARIHDVTFGGSRTT